MLDHLLVWVDRKPLLLSPSRRLWGVLLQSRLLPQLHPLEVCHNLLLRRLRQPPTYHLPLKTQRDPQALVSSPLLGLLLYPPPWINRSRSLTNLLSTATSLLLPSHTILLLAPDYYHLVLAPRHPISYLGRPRVSSLLRHHLVQPLANSLKRPHRALHSHLTCSNVLGPLSLCSVHSVLRRPVYAPR